ncbi:MAG: hypothetical protein Q8932_19960, partial [Bacteroidota bacterium]|nr:hypothetical protein [Bacteroidota bacterium]
VNADTSIFNNMRINARNIGDSLMFFLLATDKYGNVIKVLPQRFPSMDSTNDGYNHQPNYGNLSVTGNLNAGTGARISGVPVYTSGAGIIFGYGNRDLNADALDIGGSHYGDFVFANGRLVFGNSNVAVRRNFEAYIRGRLNSTGVYVDQDSSEVDPQDSVMLTTMLTNTRGGQIETYQHKAAGNLYFPIFVNKNSKKPVIYNSLIDNGFGHQIWNDEWIQDSLQIGQTRLGDITADSQLVKHGNTVRAVAPQLPAVRASADVTAATGTSSVTTFTPTADGQYQINAYVNITAHTGGEVLITTLTYTDEQNASQTLTFFPQGQTSGTISSSGPADLQPKFIKAKASTAITVTVTFNSVGTVTYDASAAITQLK